LCRIVARPPNLVAKLATTRMLDPDTASHSLGETLGLGDVPVREVYAAFDWWARSKASSRTTSPGATSRKALVLYDVTSTYLGGRHCELARHGYSRDKRGDRAQLVIGLLCAADDQWRDH
jgi:hypothetical protein